MRIYVHLGLEKRARSGGLGQLQIVASWSHLRAFKALAYTRGFDDTCHSTGVCNLSKQIFQLQSRPQ